MRIVNFFLYFQNIVGYRKRSIILTDFYWNIFFILDIKYLQKQRVKNDIWICEIWQNLLDHLSRKTQLDAVRAVNITTPWRNIKRLWHLRHYQEILILFHNGGLWEINIFKLCVKIWEMCDKNNIGLIYFRLGRSELHWLFSIFT